MNTKAAVTYDPIAEYLNEVRAGLKKFPESERWEILSEIQSHLEERRREFASRGFQQPSEAAVAAMGDANHLAKQFARSVVVEKASRSFAPWTLLFGAARIASTGAKAVATVMLGFVGYAIGLVFAVTAVLKTLMPSRVGFWVGPDVFVVGIAPSHAGARELAGPYLIPVSIVCAFLFASGTTLLLRRWTRSKASGLTVLK